MEELSLLIDRIQNATLTFHECAIICGSIVVLSALTLYFSEIHKKISNDLNKYGVVMKCNTLMYLPVRLVELSSRALIMFTLSAPILPGYSYLEVYSVALAVIPATLMRRFMQV